MRIKSLIIFTFISISSLASDQCPTKREVVSYGFKDVFSCENNLITKVETIHIKSGNRTGLDNYKDGKKVESLAWNVEGVLRYHSKFTYLKDNLIQKDVLGTSKENKGKLKDREILYRNGNTAYVVKSWIIKNYRPVAIYHLNQGEQTPWRIDTLNKNHEIQRTYLVEFNQYNLMAKMVKSFTVLDPSGKVIGKYDESRPFDINYILENLNISKSEKKRRLNIYNDKTRTPVVIIDTGFDFSHPDLAHKVYNSPYDIYGDGIDNDGNGRVDDSHGWQRHDDPGIDLVRDDNNINEVHSLVHTPMPVSHGTHVAALALRDLENFGLVGFAGDMALRDHLIKIAEYIRDKNIRFSNMSFAIGAPGAMMSAPRESFDALKSIIVNNPQTLFTVAAGNSRPGYDLDQPGGDNFPASYDFKNMIKVGAINTAEIDYSAYPIYKKASFSKFGNTKVQIFAPGQGVMSAQSGGGNIPLNGTSMASPYVLNIILKGHTLSPKTSNEKLKEILLKTAYVPALKPFEAQSGGVVHPVRFYAALENFKTMPLEAAIQKAVEKTPMLKEMDLYSKIQLWNERGL